MKIYKIVVLLSILSLVFINNVNGQDTLKIDKSNNKVFITGKPFYIHIVKRGQTLYRIAKAYNVTVDDIERENFNIKAEGLSIGQPVKIPVKKEEPPKASKQIKIPKTHIVDSGETAYSIARKYHLSLKDLYALNPQAETTIYPGQRIYLPAAPDTTTVKILRDKDFIYHIIDSGQTFYSIAKKYGVKARQVEKENDNIDPDNLRPGQVVKIPTNRVDVRSEKPEQADKKYYYHNVTPGETLYSLAQQYQTDIETIKKQNPNLSEREMVVGEYLKLPRNKITIPEKFQEKQPIADVFKTETMLQDTCKCPQSGGQDHLQIALMLPLYSYINDTLNLNRTYPKIYGPSKIFIDFYEGALLAVNKLSDKGLNIDLHVLDTENDTLKVKEIINDNYFPYFDLIIGPVYSQNLPLVVEKAREFSIPVVSPLSTSCEFLDNYPFGFQVSPTNEILFNKTLESIEYFEADNYIIIKNGNKPEEKFVKSFKETFFKGKTMEEIEHLGYAEIIYYAGDEELNLDPFVDSLHNFVIVPSSDRAFVSDVISRLNTLNETHKITLFGHPRLINYTNIDVKFFHNLNTHIFNLNFIDYNKKSVNDFVYEFRKFYEKEPDKYAFYGYDISYYFIHAMQLFGKQFYCCFDRYYPDLLQMQFNFSQKASGAGFINKKMLMLNFQRNYLLRPIELSKK